MHSLVSVTSSFAASPAAAPFAGALVVAVAVQLLASAAMMGRYGSTRVLGGALASSAGLGLLLVVLMDGGHIALRLAATGLDTPYALSVGLWLDRMTCAMVAVVGFVGFIVFRFSRTYLRSEPTRDRFLTWLATTVVLVQLFVLSSSLLGHALAWFGLSVSVHKLLRHYDERYRARLVARKKFLTSRLGDLLFWAAICLLYARSGTLDLQELSAGYPGLGDAPSGANTIGLLVACAALCKSAQFPLHSWLPDTMDAPTPVSALMHAGVVNAGAFLLLRTTFLLQHSPAALCALAVVGGLSACLGTLVGSLQANTKTRLAWSTVAQMGFLFFELGLGFAGAAALHLAAHSVYKAHAFLRTGTLPQPRPSADVSALRILAAMGAALLIAGASGVIVRPWLPRDLGAYLPLAFVWTLGLSQLLIGPRHASLGSRLAALLVLGSCSWASAWALESALATWAGPLTSPLMHSASTAALVWAVTGLLGVALFLGTASRWPGQRLQSFYVHALSGFYLGELHDKLTLLLWRDRPAAALPQLTEAGLNS